MDRQMDKQTDIALVTVESLLCLKMCKKFKSKFCQSYMSQH